MLVQVIIKSRNAAVSRGASCCGGFAFVSWFFSSVAVWLLVPVWWPVACCWSAVLFVLVSLGSAGLVCVLVFALPGWFLASGLAFAALVGSGPSPVRHGGGRSAVFVLVCGSLGVLGIKVALKIRPL